VRFARGYLLLHPDDCTPPHGLDLEPGSRDSIKVEKLTEAFLKDGFDPNEPALVGYPLDGKIQLVTGTHRHEAAVRSGILLPVVIRLRSVVDTLWGTDGWAHYVADIKVKDLESVEVQDGGPAPSLEERVNLIWDME
jgi:hypothetical protein